jgi:putative transcriptional regulator
MVMSLAGSFLIARPRLQDPTFARTVILMLAHDNQGALGLVVNRPGEAEEFPLPVFFGGPCPSPGLFLLHGHEEWLDAPQELTESSGKREVAPGIFLGDASCLERANHQTPVEGLRIRIFRGCAGWGPGQLEHELAAGAWDVTPATGPLLFSTPIQELWQQASPPRIPQPSLN